MKTLFLLDVDDTLLDFQRSEREQLLATLHAYGIAADEGTAARYHVINDGLWKKLERGERTRERLAVERFEILLAERGVQADAQALSRHYFEGMAHCAHAIGGAQDFLAALSARGTLYAVTNGAKALQRRRMASAGIASYFADVFISEEVGCSKPGDGYVNYVLSHIPHFVRGNAVYVGDSLTSDMVCAQKMGVDFILYRKERPEGYAGMWADSYRAVLSCIDAL